MTTFLHVHNNPERVPTSEPPSPLYGLVDGLEAGQEGVVVVGADLVLIDKISVQIVELPVTLLHSRPLEDGESVRYSDTNTRLKMTRFYCVFTVFLLCF